MISGVETARTLTLSELTDAADVTPRTVRYYIQQGLLPAPSGVGPGAHYGPGHVSRLRLIRRLQREHLPLAEIRARLAPLSDAEVEGLLRTPQPRQMAESAVDYVRSLLGGDEGPTSGERPAPRAASAPPPLPRQEGAKLMFADASSAPGVPRRIDRSQWERIELAPDIELHVRRPLSRHQNRQVERLVSLARQLFEEERP